jgi:hypothetical protein
MIYSPLTSTLQRVGLFVFLMMLLFSFASPIHAEPETPTAVQLGDFVWREGRAIHNGIQEAGEGGLPYAPVNLYQGTTLISVTNASNVGIYSLDVTNPGTYILEMPIPSYLGGLAGFGLQSSPQNAGGNDLLDSDVSVSTRRATITVGASSNNTNDGAVYDSSTSMTYCTGKQMTFTNWSETFSLLKADPSLGTLVGVYLRASAGSAQNAMLTNNQPAPQTFSYIGGVVNSLTLPDGTELSTQTGRTVSNINLAGNGSIALEDLVDYKTTDQMIDISNFSFYQGDGGFNDFFSIPALSQGVTTVVGGGNIIATAQTRAYSTVCITYVFDLPLSAELSQFEASCRVDTNVDVTWETAEEVGTLGFNLLRASASDGTPEQLNQDLILAQSPGGGGATYQWNDDSVKADGEYYYWLDSIDTQGTATRHGPVSASVPCNTPTAVTLSSLSISAMPFDTALLVGIGVCVGLGALGGLLRKRR